jgi:hypothetical protein
VLFSGFVSCFESYWPLPSNDQRWRWLGLGGLKEGVVCSLQVASSSNSSRGGRADSKENTASAAGLQGFPLHQQQAVLQLLFTTLEQWPSDIDKLPVAVVADGLFKLFAADQTSASGQGALTALIPRLLQQLDASAGAVYGHLLLRCGQEGVKRHSGEEGSVGDGVVSDEHAALLDLLWLILSSPTADPAAAEALLKLLAGPDDQVAAVATVAALLQNAVLAGSDPQNLLVLLLDATGPSASTALLGALASCSNSCILMALLHLAAMPRTNLSAASSTAVYVLVARLCPYPDDFSVAAGAVEFLLTAPTPQYMESQGSLAGSVCPLVAFVGCRLLFCDISQRELTAVLELAAKLGGGEMSCSSAAATGVAAAAAAPSLTSFPPLSSSSSSSTSTAAVSTGAARPPPSSYPLVASYVADLLQQLSQQPRAMSGGVESAASSHFGHVAAMLPTLTSSLSLASRSSSSSQAQNLQHQVHTSLLQQVPTLAGLLGADSSDVAVNAAKCLMRLLPGFAEEDVQQLLTQVAPMTITNGCAGAHIAAASVPFFLPHQAAAQQSHAITSLDFVKASELLMTHLQKARAAAASHNPSSEQHRLPSLLTASSQLTACGGVGESSVEALGDGNSIARSRPALVCTPTTEANLCRILDVVDNPVPLLLEGATGVGKSATVAEAARLLGKRLVRFNMSSHLTPDDLLGRVVLRRAGTGATGPKGLGSQGNMFEYQLQPFAQAYVEGHCLLLDELNLARDDVLQCIEQALDKEVSTDMLTKCLCTSTWVCVR